ncbi:MAG: hypothetical protein EAZ31_07995 [Cytophagia bacterium]|nr:MAG: hypothetical protein EAZ31_07995 [Cytophagia bacterium]
MQVCNWRFSKKNNAELKTELKTLPACVGKVFVVASMADIENVCRYAGFCAYSGQLQTTKPFLLKLKNSTNTLIIK